MVAMVQVPLFGWSTTGAPDSLCGAGERLVLLRHKIPKIGFFVDQLDAETVLASVAAKGA